ncbi:MAG: 7,8-didemethyl-8-hydroxy-5-deazariboflavin synthase subunit CofH, partial [Halobacteria archaeon]|nr:7,8-didemethyl-8-hydroxy-5-deazariboflavin synthase subunit CofH [Halobacteria archaeon]
MADAFRTQTEVNSDDFDFDNTPSDSTSSFENALEKARAGNRLSLSDAVELLTTGTENEGINQERKQK